MTNRTLRHDVLRASVALALFAGSMTWSVGLFGPSPAAAGPTPTLAVEPGTALVDFQPVRLTGSGFEPDTLLEWFQCRGGATGAADCDGYNADFIDVDGAGNVDVEIYVDARIFLPDGTEVDCRTDPAGCELGVGFLVDADEWPEVALEFDPTAPLRPVVAGSVTPDRELVDGQVVALRGEHLSFREETFAYLCRVGDEPVGERCDLDGLARGVPDRDGVATGELAVNAPFDPPLGDPVDCRDVGTSCAVEITWGFAPPPDRDAIVPVSFRPLEPVVPTSTTAPPPSVPPPAVPPSPGPASPAVPLPAVPSFTG